LILLPYIKSEKRKKYEKIIQELIGILKSLPPEEVDGDLNYVVTKLLKEVYPLRYYHINKAVGVLECIKLEFYRRVAAPYEDIKIKESGDV
jgi:ribosomal protein S3AE